MSDPHRNPETELERSDADFVRRIARTYRPPQPLARGGASFRAGIDARIRRRAQIRSWVVSATPVAVAVATALVLWRGGVASGPSAPERAPALSAEEAVLSLAVSDADEAEGLPADYQAIDDLFLDEGEGVY